MEKNIYKAASKQNLLFALGENGQKLTVNQLWSLPLNTNDPKGLSLNALAVELKHQIDQSPKLNFVDETTSVDDSIQLRFDIVIDIIETKKADNKAKLVSAEMQSLRKKAKEELAKRGDKKFENLSDEELRAIADGKAL